MPLRIAHISDSHFGTEVSEVVEALKECLHVKKPDIVLFSGDITQRARSSQFKSAQKFINDLSPLKTVLVPGNHDIPLFDIFTRLFFPYRNFKKHLGSKKESHINLDESFILAMNSTSWKRHIQGWLCPQRTQKKLDMDIKSSKFKVVFFHHPLICSKLIDEKNLLKNRTEIFRVLAKNRVDLVLGGHIHDPHVALTTGGFVAAVAGTCISHRVRKGAPNSFNWIEFSRSGSESQDGNLSVRRMDFSIFGKFEEVSEAKFKRQSGTWLAVS